MWTVIWCDWGASMNSQIFWFGDLNYRLNMEDADVRKLIALKRWDELVSNDQVRSSNFLHNHSNIFNFYPQYETFMTRIHFTGQWYRNSASKCQWYLMQLNIGSNFESKLMVLSCSHLILILRVAEDTTKYKHYSFKFFFFWNPTMFIMNSSGNSINIL